MLRIVLTLMILIEAQLLLPNSSVRAKGLGSTSHASKRIHLLTKSIRTEHPLDNISRQYMTSPISVRTSQAFTEHPTLSYRSDSLRISSVQQVSVTEHFKKCRLGRQGDVPVHQRTFKVV
jgi:hypothetical protein